MQRRGFLSRRRCCCVSSKICFTACFVPVQGATFTVTGLGSCVTGSDGCCDAPWLTSGSHTWTAVDSGGTTICSGGGTWTAGTTNTKNCTPSDGVCCGSYYIPNNLTATDALGSFGMAYTGTDISGNPQWEGCRVVTVTSATADTSGGTCNVPGPPASGPVRICYIMTCQSSGSPAFTIVRIWPFITTNGGILTYFQDPTTCGSGPCNNPPPLLCGSPNVSTASGSAASATTTPFSVSFSLSTDPGAALPDPVGGGLVVSA